MPKRLLTVTGPDRPGLIAAISGILADEGADMEDVSMTRLEGNFAMIVVCRGGDEQRLRDRLFDKGRELDLHIHLEPAVERDVKQQPNAFISAIGPNRIGIVASISGILARHDVNIIEMTTQYLEKTSTPVYVIRLEGYVPGDWDALLKDLKKAGQDLGVEVQAEPMQQAEM